MIGFSVLLGCTLASTTPLGKAAMDARASPVVADVRYEPANWLDGEHLDVTVVEHPDQKELRRLWCDVLVPAGANETNAVVANARGSRVSLPRC